MPSFTSNDGLEIIFRFFIATNLDIFSCPFQIGKYYYILYSSRKECVIYMYSSHAFESNSWISKIINSQYA